jgi:hypothetical protein
MVAMASLPSVSAAHSRPRWRVAVARALVPAIAVAALYAMLLQAFFAGLNAAERPFAAAPSAALCLTEAGAAPDAGDPGAPAGSGAHECVCLAACHGGLALAGALAALARPHATRAVLAAWAPDVSPPPHPLALPPARGPPHAGQSHFA